MSIIHFYHFSNKNTYAWFLLRSIVKTRTPPMFVPYQLLLVFALHMRDFFYPRGFFSMCRFNNHLCWTLIWLGGECHKQCPLYRESIALGTMNPRTMNRPNSEWVKSTQKDTFSTFNPQRILIGARMRIILFLQDKDMTDVQSLRWTCEDHTYISLSKVLVAEIPGLRLTIGIRKM